LSTHLLKGFISAFSLLKEEEWLAFESIWQPFEAKRKEVLTSVGETERYLYFVVEGVQRGFAVTNEGNEATIVFSYPYSFSGVADSFLTQTPSAYFLETLTASKFLRTTHQQLQGLMYQYPAIQAMVLKITAIVFKGVLERGVEMQVLSAEEKFKRLLARSPQVLNLIAHKYLASYLGMDAATFSRLLSTVRIS
jgi:CRP-like cAMP-binding protein